MNNENESVKLDADQLSEVAGGGGTRKDKDTDMVRCPNCGAANDVPAKAGSSIACFKCGKEITL